MSNYLKHITFYNICNVINAKEEYLNYNDIKLWAFILFIVLISYAWKIQTWTGCQYRKNFYRILLPATSFISTLILARSGFSPAEDLPIIFTLIITFILHLGFKESAEKWIQNNRSMNK